MPEEPIEAILVPNGPHNGPHNGAISITDTWTALTPLHDNLSDPQNRQIRDRRSIIRVATPVAAVTVSSAPEADEDVAGANSRQKWNEKKKTSRFSLFYLTTKKN